MSLLAYAVAEQDAGVIDGVGLDERPLFGIGHQGLALVVSQHEYPLPEPTAQMLWRYEEVVERLMGSQSILPARFGSMLADEAEAVSALRARHDELRRSLARVRGALEMGVRATWTPPPTQARAGTGTDYLLGQLDVRRRAKHCAGSMDPLLALARDSSVKILPRPSVPFIAAYLVDRDQIEEFTDLASQLAAEWDDEELIVTGPWPPYSFAQAAALDRVPQGETA
jgi:hypothetical protein